ncbi:MAG TPA: discoidin domain-containing protein, partial [Pseudonocardiaceae bacterium]|nr:discoidin domain-containing protein [Pseudonocardiaceae bacterium]
MRTTLLRALVPPIALAGLVLLPAPATSAPNAPTAHSAAQTALPEAGWTASSNTNPAAADAPANAIDGNPNTRFSSDAVQAPGMWFQVDMGSAQSFDQLEMDATDWPGDYAVGYNVEVSTNGSTFTSVATGSGSANPEIVGFTAQTARYIRVVLTAASSVPWWSIGQFTVFTGSGTGTSGSGAPPDSFWGDTTSIPAAKNILEIKIINQTNGQYPDNQVYWNFNGTTQ